MVLISQYAGVGEACPAFTVAAASGGNLTGSGTLYFSFQLQNRAGFNLPSVSSAIAYTTNQKITITIPASVMKDGWDIHYFIVSAGATSDPATHVQIARLPGYEYGIGIEPQSVRVTLPQDIVLSRPAHIALAPSIATLTNFPTGSERLDGQVRWVTSESKWFEYRADSDLDASVDVIDADIGQWVRIGGASTYVGDTQAGVGSDRPIDTINPVTTIPTPPYPGGVGLGKTLPAWEQQLWIYNDNTVALPAGIEFGIELEFNNKRSPELLSGLFLIKFIGYVQADGTIKTTDSNGNNFPNLGAFFPWTPRLTTPFITPTDLQPTEAIALAVKPYFSVAELNNEVAPDSIIGIYPAIRPQSGDYNPLGKILPDGFVYPSDDRYRVVPNTGLSYDILTGTALVAGYDFPTKPRRTFGGLSPNTAGQQVIINGNGAVFTEPSSYNPGASEAIRAVISTVSGVSSASSWSSYVAISSTQAVQVTLTYPCDADGYGTVRSDYPDVLANNNKALFNPPFVRLYLQRQDTSEIRYFSGYAVIADTGQIFTVTNWSSGTIVPSLPTAASDFSLFAPSTATPTATTGGTFPATSYRATYAFDYDGNQVTVISHDSPPAIPEWEGDFSPPSITVVSTTTLAAGTPAYVNNISSVSNIAELEFGIPKGESGTTWTSKSADYTATGGDRLLVDTTTPWTLTLPASPTANDAIAILGRGTLATNPLNINFNGQKFKSVTPTNPVTFSKDYKQLSLIWISSAIGWIPDPDAAIS